MIPHWMTFAWNDTYTYAGCLMLLSCALIRMNDWYSSMKAHRAERALRPNVLFALEHERVTHDLWKKG